MSKRWILALLLLPILATSVRAAEYHVKYKGDHRRSEPTAETALVYFFRPAVSGAAIRTWGFADDQLIGVCRARGYFFAQVAPGTRIFWSKAENTSAMELEVEAGQTYYFKQAIRMGLGKARVKMVRIDEAEAEKHFKKCSFTEPTEEGRKRGAEIVENRLERARTKAAERKAKGQ